MDEPKLAEELKKMQAEPLLPIEKKLIVGSVVLGLVLIAVLVWVRSLLFGNAV
ncbi:MAG: hypothetical protein JST11_30895 [Acidobacteria bacterium]|nr:hypothetical protein [Acidobacteriota bacterium]